MAVFHFDSGDGSALPLAYRLKRDGHQVTFRVSDQKTAGIGKGVVPYSEKPPQGAVVICDVTGKGAEGKRLRSQGFRVIGANTFDEDLELDRAEGARIMRVGGIKTPPTFPFRTIKDALKFLDGVQGSWFVKVSGADAAGGADTFDAPDSESMIRYLKWVETLGKIKPFELQQKVTGTEVSTNGWFDGERFVPPFDLTLEEKRFMPGDLGPRTGCESCVVWHSSNTVLASRTVRRIADQLRERGYVGPIDCNAIVDEDGVPLGLEWTARLGFDATQAWARLFDRTLGEQLEQFAHGKLTRWEPLPHLSATLRISVPPYPEGNAVELSKLAGLPLDRRILGDPMIDPLDVTGEATMAGGYGVVCTVGATGQDLGKLRDDLLRRASDLEIPNKQYRNDPLSGMNKRLEDLNKLGLA